MKIFVRGNQTNPAIIDIVVDAGYSIDPRTIAAAERIPHPKLPSRPVISRHKKKIKQWMIDDFEAFMEDIEWLCEVNYGLIGTYKNVSPDHSHYYNYLATDADGNVIANIRIRLRISNHSPKRSASQKYNKDQELKSEKLKEYLTDEQIENLETYTRIITVNGEKYGSYEEAFDYAKKVIKRAVEVASR